MSDDQRKATDILLSIEEKINVLLKLVSVYDLNTKLILDRTNKIFSMIENIPLNSNKQEKQILIKEEIKEKPILISKDDVLDIEEKPSLMKRSPKQSTKGDRKVPVLQKVVIKHNGNEKDAFAADVSVVDEDKMLVHKAKTNATGKWQAQLKPGKYEIIASKTDSETKKVFKSTQEILIEDSDSPIKLSNIVIVKDF